MPLETDGLVKYEEWMMKEDSFGGEPERLREEAARDLAEIGRTIMPFGRCKGRALYDIPAEYLQWFAHHGWPKGRLGDLMRMVYQMKADGSDVAFDVFRGKGGGRPKADR